MLVDVKIGGMHPVVAAALGVAPRRISRGIYDNCGFNFANTVDRSAFDDLFMFESGPAKEHPVPSYGVADSIEQFVEKFGKLLDESPDEFAVGFTEVRRADQPLEGGWRWHKWGEYIGTKTPTHEYLHDEPDITSVVTFSVVRRKK